MEKEMIEHCAQFVDEVNKGLPQPITKEEYIGQMKMYFPGLKRWRSPCTQDPFIGTISGQIFRYSYRCQTRLI